MTDLPVGVVPIRDLTTRDILYGARTTRFRYELLAHDAVTGRDSLAGELDGVLSGSLSWSSTAAVKKSGSLKVLDLATAADGATRIADVALVATRIRPVLEIEGLPEMPLGVYLVTASPEEWSATHRVLSLELHDRTTVLEQDRTEGTFTAPTGTPILAIVSSVIESAGETIDVDASETLTLGSPMVWKAGTSKLAIVNDLLEALGYQGLWVDGAGAFRATPYVRPAMRPIHYAILNDEAGRALVRELADGPQSIYSPEWTHDRDSYDIPNKVVAVASGNAKDAPSIGVATNEDSSSPYSYPSRGRWVVTVVDGVEVPDYADQPDPDAAEVAFLRERARQVLIASSSSQATVSVKCLPIPVELLDAVRFASTPAGVDARHTVTSVGMDLRFDGLMSLELREVVDL